MKKHLNRDPVHPGEVLREDVLKNLDLSVSEAAVSQFYGEYI